MPVLQESYMLLPWQTEKVRMDSRKEEETRRTNMVKSEPNFLFEKYENFESKITIIKRNFLLRVCFFQSTNKCFVSRSLFFNYSNFFLEICLHRVFVLINH